MACWTRPGRVDGWIQGSHEGCPYGFADQYQRIDGWIQGSHEGCPYGFRRKPDSMEPGGRDGGRSCS